MPRAVIRTTIQTVGSHQSSHNLPLGVIKRGIKATITATMARSYRDAYIQSSQHRHKVDRQKNTQKYSLLHYYIDLFFYKELSYTDFGIRDIVVGTTPVTSLRVLSHHFHSHRHEGLAPSRRTYFGWRVCTSLVWRRLWEQHFRA